MTPSGLNLHVQQCQLWEVCPERYIESWVCSLALTLVSLDEEVVQPLLALISLSVKSRVQMKPVVLQQAGAALCAFEMVNGLFGAESKAEWEGGTRLISIFAARNRPVPGKLFLPGRQSQPLLGTLIFKVSFSFNFVHLRLYCMLYAFESLIQLRREMSL